MNVITAVDTLNSKTLKLPLNQCLHIDFHTKYIPQISWFYIPHRFSLTTGGRVLRHLRLKQSFTIHKNGVACSFVLVNNLLTIQIESTFFLFPLGFQEKNEQSFNFRASKCSQLDRVYML